MPHSRPYIRSVWIPALLLLSGCATREPFEEVQLENGLKVVFTSAQSPITSAVFLLDYGDADGPPGLARLTNLALLRGNAIRNREQVYQEIESAGGLIVVETGLTSSVVGVQSPSDNFEACFRILCECLSQSTFDSTELVKTDANSWGLDLDRKGGLLLKKQVWNDQDVRMRLYPDSPLARHLSSNTPRFTRDRVIEFAKDHLRPEMMVLSVAGTCPRRQIINAVRHTWTAPRNRPAAAAFDTAAGVSEQPPASGKRGGGAGKDMAIFAVRGMKAYGDAFIGEYLAISSLAAEKERTFISALAAHGIAPAEPLNYTQYENDYAYTVVQVSVPRGRGEQTLELMKREMESAAGSGLSSAAFQTAKRRLQSALAIQSQYTIQNAFFSGQAAQSGIPYRTLASLQSRVEAVTLDEVNRSYSALMRRSRFWVSPAGNP